MIPKKELKIEKREHLVTLIDGFIKGGYINIELGKILGVHKNVISGLRIKKSNYPISLRKLGPVLRKAEELQKKMV